MIHHSFLAISVFTILLAGCLDTHKPKDAPQVKEMSPKTIKTNEPIKERRARVVQVFKVYEMYDVEDDP